jgi:hypothetical protein
MPKRSLILYSSWTGNTEKVAIRFKKVFEEKGWTCDAFKIDKKTDIANPPFDYGDYDFLCAGSPVIIGQPTEEMIAILTKTPYSPHQFQPTREDIAREAALRKDPDYMPQPPRRPPKDHKPVGKIVPGPKKGVAFVSYGGVHLGPKEAASALAALENEIEHLRFECIGSFACPGKHGNQPTPDWYHGDMRGRPSERDLVKAEIFLAEKLEEYC